MAFPVEKKHYTIAEYLEMEEKAEERHEYHDGEILAMSGGTDLHSLILINLYATLKPALKGTPCRIYDCNMRLRILNQNRYVYPDATIVCGPVAFDHGDPKRTTINNPKVVIEVLSESTERYDRGAKFGFYRDVPTLEEYVLISQFEPSIEVFQRQSGGSWLLHPYRERNAQLQLHSLGVKFSASDIFDEIDFAATRKLRINQEDSN